MAAAEDDRGWPYLGVQGGLLGVGATVGYDVLDSVAVRGQINRLDYSYDGREAGNEYTGNLALSSTALFLDWHAGGAFRLTAGAVYNGNELTVDATSTALDIGSGRYDGVLGVRMTFDQLAPYAGIGWSSRRGERGVGVVVDVGVLFQGVPGLAADGAVEARGVGRCEVSVAADSVTTLSGPGCGALVGLREDATREHEELADALADFEFYPVATLGLVYRF